MPDWMRRLFWILAFVAGLQLQGGMALAQGAVDENLLDDLSADYAQSEESKVPDPLEGWNRLVFSVNDKLYIYALQPAARGYAAAIPREIRTGLKNVFANLGYPIRMVNCVLQGKFDRAARETGAFLLNSSVGGLGLLDVAKTMPGLNAPQPREDTGQTLGHWGLPQGLYLVWPVVGPSTLRDSLGRFGDYFLNPLSFVDPSWLGTSLKIGDRINTQSFNPDEYEELKQGALDPYTSFQDGYLQYRRKQVQQ